MEIDETKMKVCKEPSVWQKLRNSIVALLFGVFVLQVTPLSFVIVFFPNSTVFYLILSSYGIICLLMGWFYGDYFVSYLHVKIENWWSPRDMFRP
ncbi:hypothetical protein LX73_0873 [Fodinibius salinus]|uniref:Uncharacterized protein n=1 Tax=Fodinibius salinus TaxID=860790 RepID=A0A5D3YNW3_9BACT|nr:hypothetical protein LX73_0873 [Fodinibius salinus]